MSKNPDKDADASGLLQGGLGGPEDQLLEAGQEEVFSRAEVESGRIEHHADTQTTPSPEEVEPSSPNADENVRNGRDGDGNAVAVSQNRT
ncbi:hypothetical protein [Brevundimonas sp.]|jgi:hypothetical protein|uniref:hypothetical protein n=1 Tax=Brevundimonas sp. TaxID=1871086 RepID=UPI00182A358F|nr:hypothetical protein [Brevundimonas sp.]MBA4809245.1 hypothetical protein [Brevundimonas sp.]